MPGGKHIPGNATAPIDTLLFLGNAEADLIITKPETLNDPANRIFHSVEKED